MINHKPRKHMRDSNVKCVRCAWCGSWIPEDKADWLFEDEKVHYFCDSIEKFKYMRNEQHAAKKNDKRLLQIIHGQGLVVGCQLLVVGCW